MSGALHKLAPWALLGMAFLAWFESYLPGHEFVAKTFGHDAVLRFVLGVLCLYVLLLEAARRHMQAAYKSLVDALRQFTQAQGSDPGGLGEDSQRQAVELLIGALSAEDPKVRANAQHHLRRLTGQDLGEDVAAWRSWAAQNLPAAE